MTEGNKTYLVTGIAGFIASKVAEILTDQGHKVIGIDNLNDYYDVRLKIYRLAKLLGVEHKFHSGIQSDPNFHKSSEYWGDIFSENKSNFKITKISSTNFRSEAYSTESLDSNITYYHGNIENNIILNYLFETYKFDGVFNLAARAGVRYSIENPGVYMTTNANASLSLLECCKEYNVQKYILASTSSLYAGQPMPFHEDLPVNTPISPYAASKKAAEVMAYAYHNLFGVDVSIVRYFTVFGPCGRPDMSIFRFIKWIDEQLPIELYGDGKQTRDFTYIDDIAKGTILAKKNLGYEIINLGGGNQPIDLLYIIKFIEKKLNKNAKINYLPFHKADIKETSANIDKARSSLCWNPSVTTLDGIEKTINWYLKNKYWLKNITLNN